MLKRIIPHRDWGFQVADLQAQITSTSYYPDTVAGWFSAKPSEQHLGVLRRSCGDYYDRRGLIKESRFDKELVYYIDAKQPSMVFLMTLLELEKTMRVYVNHVHLARDEHCTTPQWMKTLHQFRCTHEVRLWHRKSQLLYSYEGGDYDDTNQGFGNTYDGPKNAKRMLHRYMQKHSRLGHGDNVVHSEFQLDSKQSVESAWIITVKDLIELSRQKHMKWWSDKTRLITLPDLQRLGRMRRNQCNHTRSRTSPIEVWQRGSYRREVDMDWRLGFEAWLVSDDTDFELQRLVDQFGVARLQQAGVLSVIEWPELER